MILRGVVGLVVLLLVSSAAFAGSELDSICTLVLQQERVELEERVLAVDLGDSRRNAAESIFKLVDELWKIEAIERMIFLAAKHDRDVATIELQRRRLLVERQQAEVDQYAAICSSDEDSRSLRESARRRYRQADCGRIGKDLARAKVDLAYLTEVLASVRDLRESNVATRQDVIRAERDAEMARKRVERHEPRVHSCLDSGATVESPSSPTRTGPGLRSLEPTQRIDGSVLTDPGGRVDPQSGHGPGRP